MANNFSALKQKMSNSGTCSLFGFLFDQFFRLSFSLSSYKKVLKGFFKKYDTNGDNVMSRDELALLLADLGVMRFRVHCLSVADITLGALGRAP